MKLEKKETPKGYTFILKMSAEDLAENDLLTSFSINNLEKYDLIRRGRFDNFVNNYIITHCYDKMNEYVIPGAQRPLYKIHGESDNFVEVVAFFPKNTHKNDFESPTPENTQKDRRNFDAIYNNKEAFTPAEPGWEPNGENRVKQVAKS